MAGTSRSATALTQLICSSLGFPDRTLLTSSSGATSAQGGTRGKTLVIGGTNAMPFHHWEGRIPHRPLVAMEVFDTISPKYPPVLREIFGDLLTKPAEMAKVCVGKYGADLISVRLEGTHPEKGNRSPEQSLELVKSVLAAVDVRLDPAGRLMGLEVEPWALGSGARAPPGRRPNR